MYRTIFAVLLWTTLAHTQGRTSVSQYAPLSVSREPVLGETLTERQIREALGSLPYFGVFDHLAYRVDGYTVTLFGEVLNTELRQDAVVVVQAIPGVCQVNDEIRFLAVSPPENELRRAVYRAIYGDRVLGWYARVTPGSIHIVVQGSRVTLEGEVFSRAHSQRAVQETKEIHGVSQVINHLVVSN